MTPPLVSSLGHALQLLLGIVFVVASVGKLKNPSRFIEAVRGYQVLPNGLSLPAAVSVIAVEGSLSFSLLSGQGLRVSVPVAGALLVGFAVAVAVNLRRRRIVPCGCFGSVNEQISTRTLFRIGLLVTAVAMLGGIHTSGSLPLNLGWVVTDGSRAFRQIMPAAALGAFIAIVGAWMLHVPELRVLLGRRRVKGV